MRKYAWTIAALFLAAALAVGGLVAGAETNQTRATVDFEGLGEGSLVESLQSGVGVTGDAVAGQIAVLGIRRSAPNQSAAMIFDGTCQPGGTALWCTGWDFDLFFPDLGNLLIVSEDGDATDPDDARDGIITFDFSGFGEGSVHVESFLLIDTDKRRPTISWTTAAGTTGSERLPATGDRRWRRIDVGVDDVVEFTVDLRGEGAIDDLILVMPTTPPVTTTSTTTTTVPPTTTTSTVPPTVTTSSTTTSTSSTTTTPTVTTTSTTTVPPTVTTSSTTTSTSTTTTTPSVTTTSATTTGPAITMTHQANDESADAAPGPRLIPGDTLTWTHTVTNTGTEDLWSLIVWHDGIGRADCPTRTLRVGDTVVCTVSASADQDIYAADVDASAWAADGSQADFTSAAYYTTLDNTTTTTTTTTTIPGTTTTTTTLPPAPASLAMAVTIDGAATDAAPGPELDATLPVSLQYEITNTGGETLLSLFVWHDGIGRADCPVRTLDPGQTTLCTATAVAGEGEQASTVDAATWDAAGNRVSTDATVYWFTTIDPADPALSLELFVDGQSAVATPGPAVESGHQATIEYRATNIGGADLYALWMWEPGYGRIDCPTRTVLRGATVVCTRQITAGPGSNSGEALARAWDGTGAEVEDAAEYHFFGTALFPAVDIQVYVEGWDADSPPGPRLLTPGEVIHFTYVVTNTGQTPLTGITVDDSRRGAVTCPRSELGLAEAMTCTDTDITRWGNHGGIGTVVADAAGTRVTDNDPVYWHTRDEPRILDLRLEVSVNNDPADDAPGPIVHIPGSVQFSYVIENRGNTWMNEITIVHPGVLQSSIRCYGDRTLNAGETLRCTATVPAVAGVYAEDIMVYAWDNDGRLETAEDPVHYTAIQ